jgi:DNA-binding XRE family transcriptional regulator
VSETVGLALVRRYIGRRFEQLRRRAGISQDEAGRQLQRGRATIIRLEAGDEAVRFKDAETRAMLELYEASAEETQVLMAMSAETRNGRRKSWWHDYTETSLPPWFQMYITMEENAEFIRIYQSDVVPGLLQTRRYTEAIVRQPAGHVSDEEAHGWVELRMGRQALLARPRSPHLKAILSETVLVRTVGEPEVMAEQLRHLAEAGRQANVSVRVLPFAAGEHAGVSGGFCLFDFPVDPRSQEPLEPPLVYIDGYTGAMYLNKPAETTAHRRVWDDLDQRALAEDASREMIEATLKGLEP